MEIIVDELKPPEEKQDPKPPGRKSSLELFELGYLDSKSKAAEAAKPTQAQINGQWIAYWRGEGPRPPAGTKYREYDDDGNPINK